MNRQKSIFSTHEFWIVFLIGVLLNVAWGAVLPIRLAFNSDLLPRLRWSKEPILYAHDLLRQTFSHNYSFHYLLPTWMANYFSVNFILAFFFLLQNFLGVYAVYYLAKHLFNKRSVGYLSLFLLFPGQSLSWALGGSFPFGLNIFPGLFTIPFLLFCILYFLKRRFFAAFFLLGMMFNFHGAHAVFVLCMFTFYFLFHFSDFDKGKLIKLYLAFSLCALPLILWIFIDKLPAAGSLSQEDWILFTRIRRSHHSYPYGFLKSQWQPFFCLIALLPLAWLARPTKSKQAVMTSFLVAIVFMMIVGTLFTEVWPINPIIKFSFFRSTRFLAIILFMYLANFAYEKFRNGSLIEKALTFLVLALICNLNYQIINYMWKGSNGYLTLFLLLSVSGAFLTQYFYPRLKLGRFEVPTLLSAFCLLLIVFMGVFFTYFEQVDVFSLQFIWSLYWVLILLVVACWSVLLASLLLSSQSGQKVITAALVIILVGFSLAILWYQPPHPKRQAWYDLQIWFNKNTPKDSLVMVPPYLRGFRSFSGRGVYISWADADFLSYMPFLGEETVRRLGTVGYHYKKVFNILPLRGAGLPIDIMRTCYKDKKKGMTTKRVLQLAKQEGISHMVTEKDQIRGFPIVYENGYFLAYKLPVTQAKRPK